MGLISSAYTSTPTAAPTASASGTAMKGLALTVVTVAKSA